MSGSDSTPEKIMASSRKGTMSAGSVRKRNQISSDDEDESEIYNSPPEVIVTPSPSKRRSMSVGSVGKRFKIVSDDEDETSNDSICKSTPEMAPLPSRKRSKTEGSLRKKHEILSDDEDDTSNNSNCAFTPTYTLRASASNADVKRRLYEELTENQEKSQLSTQSNVSLENENSTNDKSYMYDSQEADSESSDDSLSGFIVEDSEMSQEMDSQDQAEVESMRQLLRKLSKKEAHELFVQMVLTSILENDHPLKKAESDPLFEKAKKVIEDDLQGRKSLVDSSAWGIDFKDMLRKCSVLEKTTLSSSMDAKCQACKRDRCLTKLFSFYHESDGELVKEFKIGCYCAAKGFLYHRIHHYCTVELKEACSIKLGELRGEMALRRELSVKDIVKRYCTKDDVKTWLNELFTDFKELLNRADRWADDGTDRRNMINAISSYCSGN